MRDQLAASPALIKQISSYAASLRGSRAYWYKRRGELKDNVSSIGIQTLFLTLSAADLWWPELYHFIVPDTGFFYASWRRNQIAKQLIAWEPDDSGLVFCGKSRILRKKSADSLFWCEGFLVAVRISASSQCPPPKSTLAEGCSKCSLNDKTRACAGCWLLWYTCHNVESRSKSTSWTDPLPAAGLIVTRLWRRSRSNGE